MTLNHVEASFCFPNYPRFCGQIFLNAADKDLARLCVEAYNDWMVDEWCGRSRRPAHPALPDPAVGRRARGRARCGATRPAACARSCFSELPPWLGLPSIHSGPLGPVLRGVLGDRHGVRHAHRVGHEDDRTSSPDAPDAVQATNIFANSALSLIDFLYSGVLVPLPGPEAAVRGGPDRLDPVRARARRRRLGGPPRVE